MFENKTEEQAKKEILDMVAEYCDTFHNKKKEFEPGDRITYASRVYDHEEMCNLVDSALEFWLTSGRYTIAFIWTYVIEISILLIFELFHSYHKISCKWF